jgi:hypothetical protein
LAAAVAAVVAAGFHPLFAIVFDEFWQLLATLAPALEPILGPGPRLIPDFWLWHVDPAADRAGSAPHRDAGYSGTLRSDGRPTLITVWLPLTDATPSNSCIYVLPLSRDPNYPVPRNVPIDASLQDIRALPAAAGSILGWNQHILHWGSRSCPEARHPRISWAMYFQSADVPDFDPLARRLSGPLSFELRLGYIGAALAIYSTRVPLPPPLKAFVLLSKRFLDSP